MRLLAAAVLSLVLAALGSLGWLIEWRFRDAIERWTTQEVTTVATRAVVAAMARVAGGSSDAFVRYQRDAQGNVAGVEYDWAAINAVISDAAGAVKEWLDRAAIRDIAIPIGEITGLRTLGGRGPSLGIRLVSAGTFRMEPFSEFSEGGFNQTVHRVGVAVEVRVAVVAPLVGEPVTVRARIPIVENQLLGKVPALLLVPARPPDPRAPGAAGSGDGSGSLTP